MESQGNRRIINVRVCNNNEETFTDYHNGDRYVFKGNGHTESIPLAAAKHIFGYDVKECDEATMFTHVTKRWGWNTPENVKAGFDKIKLTWSKFSFTPVAVKFVETPVIDTSALAEERSEPEVRESTPMKMGETTIKTGKGRAA